MEDDILNKLKKDTHIHDIIKEPLINTCLDNTDYTKRLNSILVGHYMTILKSIKLLEKNYQELIIGKERFFESIKKASNYYDTLNRLWIEINDDDRILNSFSKIIALWLSADIDPINKAKIYSDITEEISHSDTKKVISSIATIKKEYSIIYNFNSDYFNRIIRIISNPIELEKLSSIESESNQKQKKSKNIFGFKKI